jgi:uncharacterized integral membrane protein
MRIVHSLEELLDLPHDDSVNGFRTRQPLRLEIPTLAHDVLDDAQEALNRLQERGGSLAAAVVMFIALILGVLKVFHRNVSMLSGQALLELIVVLLVSFMLGTLARAAALTITRWQFGRRCREQYEALVRHMREPAVQ